jgi:hypothetical protein
MTLSSAKRVALDIGLPHPYKAASMLNNKRLENRIFLGSIKMSEFLEAIMFDNEGVTSNSEVLRAWEELAMKDEEYWALEEAHMDM